ncbi:MAG: hypothetical protein NZ455_02495 [Bacteroidia bacterium]|nr:hypothetical protein [Bacteroidia bacterium]
MLRSGRATTHYASLRCYANAAHCLTACFVSLTQKTNVIYPLKKSGYFFC